jgi:peptidyl-prolyl cis-trans isomerase A (cyclophilin A)
LAAGTPATPGSTAAGTAGTGAPYAGVAPKTIYQIDDTASSGPIALDSGSYAVFHTTDGDFMVKLFTKEAPNTTQNFMDLARGKKSWKHPITGVESNRPIYNNTTIYRIICDTIIFGGDPVNKGQGDSGLMQNLETSPDLQFDGAGLLAMDGSNDKASGSRWFITLRPFPDRSGHYTIIGKVVGGLDVVRAISNKPCKKPQVPLDPTLLNSIEIVDIPQGKRTTASFASEDGRKVVSVDPNFVTAEAAPTPAPVETQTSATAVETSSSTTMTSKTVILKP